MINCPKAAARGCRIILDVAQRQRSWRHRFMVRCRTLASEQMEIAPQSAALYGDMVARIVAAQRGLSKKCLVLDLDNTLWGGVIGDDGLEGSFLEREVRSGEAHLALQRYAKQLKERGVILAVCSRTTRQSPRLHFVTIPKCISSASDIAAFIANWDDKSENLKRIAAQLNIGIDSLGLCRRQPGRTGAHPPEPAYGICPRTTGRCC